MTERMTITVGDTQVVDQDIDITAVTIETAIDGTITMSATFEPLEA